MEKRAIGRSFQLYSCKTLQIFGPFVCRLYYALEFNS